MQKILHCRAFPQKFWVRSHAELYSAVAAVEAEDALQLLSGLGWHRAFLYHELRGKRLRGHQSRDIIDRRQIGLTVLKRQRAHANENGIRRSHSLRSVPCEGEILRSTICGEHGVEVRLVDGHYTGLQCSDPFGIVVRAEDLMTRLRKARSCHQSHIPATNHGNSQFAPPNLAL